jgi:hypothetical protein
MSLFITFMIGMMCGVVLQFWISESEIVEYSQEDPKSTKRNRF